MHIMQTTYSWGLVIIIFKSMLPLNWRVLSLNVIMAMVGLTCTVLFILKQLSMFVVLSSFLPSFELFEYFLEFPFNLPLPF